MSLIDHIARAIGGKASTTEENRPQFEEARLAGEKRAMERKLRAQGLSRTEAKTAVRLHFKARK